jgi:hypothetical protein
VLGDLQQPKKGWLQRLNGKGKKGRVKVQRINLRGKEETKRGIGGAGGLGGIDAKADTKQQVRRRKKGTFLARNPSPCQKDLKKVQSKRECLGGKGGKVRQETHGRGVRGTGGHLSRIKRR